MINLASPALCLRFRTLRHNIGQKHIVVTKLKKLASAASEEIRKAEAPTKSVLLKVAYFPFGAPDIVIVFNKRTLAIQNIRNFRKRCAFFFRTP